jgi:hypothetical protein
MDREREWCVRGIWGEGCGLRSSWGSEGGRWQRRVRVVGWEGDDMLLFIIAGKNSINT